jgi:hypothetical protein
MRATLLALGVVFALTTAGASDTQNREPHPRTGAPALPRLASASEVKDILSELAIPALPVAPKLELSAPVLFAADTLKPYARDLTIEEILRDTEKYRMRAVVLHALQTIRDTSPTTDPNAPKLPVRIDNPVTDNIKRTIREAQEQLAIAIAKIELAHEELMSVEKARATETSRWRAHYDYTLAQVRLRLAWLNEYNKLLGDVRTDNLPALPSDSPGWQLAVTKEIQSNKPVRDLAANATVAFEAIAADYKGTPWSMLARQSLLIPPGLKWEALGK